MEPREPDRSRTATPAVALLRRAGVPHHLHQIGHEPRTTAYGREAASSLRVAPERVLKTLVGSLGARLVVAVVPVSGGLDLKALASILGTKRVDLADPVLAERATGQVIGGISPIGQRRGLPTVIDQSASTWGTAFVSGGRRGLEIELAPGDLLAVTSGQLAPIGRPR